MAAEGERQQSSPNAKVAEEQVFWCNLRLQRTVSIKLMAERVGFEPTLRFRKPHFECGAIDHSATSPRDTPGPAVQPEVEEPRG